MPFCRAWSDFFDLQSDLPTPPGCVFAQGTGRHRDGLLILGRNASVEACPERCLGPVRGVAKNRDLHEVTLHVRFKGGAHKTLRLLIPPNAWQQRTTPPEVVTEIDRLLAHHTDRQVATLLNQGGWQSGEGRTFTRRIVARIRRNYGLKNRYTRLREAGLLTLSEVAQRLGISAPWVKIWRDHGLLKAQPYNDKNECLYEHPGTNPPRKMQGVKLSSRPRIFENPSNRTNEAQYEA